MIYLSLPESLHKYSNHCSPLSFDIASLAELPAAVKKQHPGLAPILFTDNLQLTGFVNLYHKDLWVDLHTKIDEDEIHIEVITALSGG